MQKLTTHRIRRPHWVRLHGRGRLLRRGAALLVILLLPVFLGAWRDASGNTINPRFVQRIKNGETKKHEILLYFGDPQEVTRTPEGPVWKYSSFKDAPAMGIKPEDRKINEQSDSLYVIDDEKKVKKAPVKKEGKILKSTLVIRFKPDGELVQSHEYQEY